MSTGTLGAGPETPLPEEDPRFAQSADPVPSRVSLTALSGGPWARQTDPAHVRRLVEQLDDSPPITVTPAGVVIDGMHRVAAAQRLGRPSLLAITLDLSEADCWVTAARANTPSSRPWSARHRRAAVTALLELTPDRSNRSIAQAVGVSEKTVRRLRACSTAALPQSNASQAPGGRKGRDGRVRPARAGDAAAAVRAELRPEDTRSGEEVARAAGVSPSTVARVRREVARNRAPSAQPRGRLVRAVALLAGMLAGLSRRAVRGVRSRLAGRRRCAKNPNAIGGGGS